MNQQQFESQESEIDIKELLEVVWRGKYFVVASVVIITAISIIIALSKPNVYQVTTTLFPQEQSKSQGGLGGLASLAGINLDTGGAISPDISFKSMLANYAFMKKFIQDRELAKKIFDKNLYKSYVFALNYDGFYKLLKHSDKEKKNINEFTIYLFLKGVLSIQNNKKTGVITVTATHPSPKFAKYVLESFLEDSTKELVKMELKTLDIKISKYKKELLITQNLELKTELAKLISNLLKQKVYMNSNKYYKTNVLSKAYIPDEQDKVAPSRKNIVIVSFIGSLIVSILLLIGIDFLKKYLNQKEEEEKEEKEKL